MPIIHEDFVRCECGGAYFTVTEQGMILKARVKTRGEPIRLDQVRYIYTCTKCGKTYIREELNKHV